MAQFEVSPLDSFHRQLGAKMVPFGGWEMPVSYQAGKLDEHMACRARRQGLANDAACIVGGSYGGYSTLMGLIRHPDLYRCGSAWVAVADPFLFLEGSWWVRDDVFDVMPNASNTDRVRSAIGGTETTRDRAVLAVQGPRAKERLAGVFAAAAEVGRFRVEELDWHGARCVVAGTGYTGEAGVEIAVPVEAAGDLWSAVVSCGVMPAGLGARDTLRLEAGMPLYGIATEGRRPPRSDCAVLHHGAHIGTVTSGNFSPVLEHGIALAFLPPDVADGDAVTVDVRGSALPGRIVPLPFVAKK